MELKTSITKYGDKLEFVYNAKEKLRLLHNAKGQEYKDGKLTEKEWNIWLNDYFMPRSQAIEKQSCELRTALLKSNIYDVDFTRDFE